MYHRMKSLELGTLMTYTFTMESMVWICPLLSIALLIDHMYIRGSSLPPLPSFYTLPHTLKVLREACDDFFENRVVPEESLIVSTSELTEIERLVRIVAFFESEMGAPLFDKT